MMKIKLIALFLFVAVSTSFAQKGKMFPSISGETLTDKTMSVPANTKGKVTLIGMAYSKKSDDLLKKWFEPIYTTFVDPPEVAFMPSSSYDTHIYFIPMLRGVAKAASGTIVKKMKQNIDKKLHNHTLVYKGAIKEYKKALKLGQKDLPYFFILDKSGKVVYHTAGAYSSAKLSDIIDAVEKYQ
ncbi:hypothetical protein AAG747_08935 [Rapidithrix thailandica]|uniref:Thioredoxin domain-containing protein n=1 Tax=Rapidithrix thailandica TaxID=413964 RepID=A0AAW9S2D2_9BACT